MAASQNVLHPLPVVGPPPPHPDPDLLGFFGRTVCVICARTHFNGTFFFRRETPEITLTSNEDESSWNQGTLSKSEGKKREKRHWLVQTLTLGHLARGWQDRTLAIQRSICRLVFLLNYLPYCLPPRNTNKLRARINYWSLCNSLLPSEQL